MDKKNICLTCDHTFESCPLKHRSEIACCPVVVCYAHKPKDSHGDSTVHNERKD